MPRSPSVIGSNPIGGATTLSGTDFQLAVSARIYGLCDFGNVFIVLETDQRALRTCERVLHRGDSTSAKLLRKQF
jgi:hypothetical protein